MHNLDKDVLAVKTFQAAGPYTAKLLNMCYENKGPEGSQEA